MSYIPNTDADRAAMLDAIGISSIHDLFSDVPESLRNPQLNVPPATSETEIRRRLRAIAAENADAGAYALFLGAGAYHHFIPSVVPYLTGRGEFATPYTPYQPEISQGTLQSIFEFQSMVCALTGMEVANASLYDGATSVVEAATMAMAVTGRSKVVISGGLNPEHKRVLLTHMAGRGVEVVDVATIRPPWQAGGRTESAAVEQVLDEAACLIVQNPSFFGTLEDLAALGAIARAKGALFVVSAYPIALGLLSPPSVYGADVVVGEGQCLGNPLYFGGPFLGLFAAKSEYMRSLPGRLVGLTRDSRGQEGFVLTLQTREQHIRREKATSNVCTNEALCALKATVYLAALGPQGLRAVAEGCVRNAHYLAQRIAEVPGFSLVFDTPFFNEFVVRCPVAPTALNQRLLAERIIGGYALGRHFPDLSDCMLLCATEMNTRAEMDRLVDVLAEVAQSGIAPGAGQEGCDA